MRLEEIALLPDRPPSEVEWEDLLVRIELMPRALRFALDAYEMSPEGVRPILTDLVEREEWAARSLEQAAGVGDSAPAPSVGGYGDAAAEEMVERFVRYRTRNFAMVQRRGVEVWDWRMTPIMPLEISAFQLLSFLARSDVRALAALREVGARGGAAC